MGKKNRRRLPQGRATRPPADPHVQAVLNSVGEQLSLRAELLSAGDPSAQAEQRLADAIEDLSTAIAEFDPVRVIEVARIRCLPWSFLPQAGASEAGLTRAEVLTLLAITGHERLAGKAGPPASPEPPECQNSSCRALRVQPVTDAVYSRIEDVDAILRNWKRPSRKSAHWPRIWTMSFCMPNSRLLAASFWSGSMARPTWLRATKTL